MVKVILCVTGIKNTGGCEVPVRMDRANTPMSESCPAKLERANHTGEEKAIFLDLFVGLKGPKE
jgi:hypothetical protein